MVIGVEFIDDHERLWELIQATAASPPAPKPKKPKVEKKELQR